MKNPIAKYIMCAYAYYEEDNPLITDFEFDDLGKWILKAAVFSYRREILKNENQE